MKIADNKPNYYTPAFGKFIKITNKHEKIDRFRKSLTSSSDEFLALETNKNKKKSSLYLFSKKHMDKFFKLFKKVHFGTLRRNLEAYMGTEPKEISLKKAKKYLK